jgi:DNA uptake protein ComE-like DNA-binding protein
MNVLRSDLGAILGALLLFLLLRVLAPLFFSAAPTNPAALSIEPLPPGWEWNPPKDQKTRFPNKDRRPILLPAVGTALLDLTEQDWRNMGLSPAQAALALRWQQEGWLNRPDRLERLSVLPGGLVAELKERLLFPAQNPKEKTEAKPVAQVQQLDLATADSLQLLKVPGLGAASVYRILTHLRYWGGWADWEEWNSLPGMDSARLFKIQQHLGPLPAIQPRAFQYIWYPELEQLWFLSARQQKALILWRNKTGAVRLSEEKCRELGMGEEEIKWLNHYLK